MAQNKEKTKETNTFRFKSFAVRIGEINLRSAALYHIGHENEELSEENETYFQQTLKKWMILNLTEEYNSFSRQCTRIVTLPQLIHRKNFVIDLLLERLATATTLSLQPLLELVYVLARDLREHFYKYFQRVLDRLICLLHTQDAEQLEWTFVCLAHMFKSLKPYLRKNIGVVFNAILPLLDEQRYEAHVINFAVECFAFVARDVRDFPKLLQFVLQTLQYEQVESLEGCGRLFFELVRGVEGQFHSMAGDFLRILFEALVDQSLHRSKTVLLDNIVRVAVDEILQFVHPNRISLLWTELTKVARAVENNSKLCDLIAVFVQVANYKDGRYLSEFDELVPTILQMLDYCIETRDIIATHLLTMLVQRILLCGSTQLTQLDASRLLKKTLTISERRIYGEFVIAMLPHAQFDLLIKPHLVVHFEEHLDAEALALLAQVVLTKMPLAVNASDLATWAPYPLLTMRQATTECMEAKLKQINVASMKFSEESIFWLLLLPHFIAVDCEPWPPVLEQQMQTLLQRLRRRTGKALDKTVILLAVLLEVYLHIYDATPDKLTRQMVRVLLKHSGNLRALGAVDQLLAQVGAAKQLEGDKAEISGKLAPLLSSHVPEVRRTAAHCLQSLHADMEHNPYAIFYQVASVEPTIQTYRDQLMLLQKLSTAGVMFKSYKDNTYKVDTVRFLLGMLYHNFKLIWEPILQMIEEYMKALPTSDFWTVYQAQLEASATGVDGDNAENGNNTAAEVEPMWKNDALNKLLTLLETPPLGQQQLVSYRNLLWSRLAKCGDLAQRKNRDLVGMFLSFVETEYRCNFEQREQMWNLKTLSADADVIDDQTLPDEEEKPAEAQTKAAQPPGKRERKQLGASTKSILQALEHKLAVFAQQPNPKALHREPELNAFYMELLAGPNAQLQRLALDCLLAYKSKALTNYKDQLYAINDEDKFRDELINFKLETVTAEDRDALMPVLLRLLYGKMLTKGTQRQVNAQVRKSLILRFLGQCSKEEIFAFMRMAFGKYEAYAGADVELTHIPALVLRDFKLEAVWSARKLQSVVNLLEIVRKEFGGLLAQECQLYMLKLLVFVGSVANAVLQVDTTQLHAKMPSVYRNLRNDALAILVNFFTHIDQFPWTQTQVACLADVYVWPAIERMPGESIHTPTPLLRLLLLWGEQPPHFQQLLLRPRGETAAPNIFNYVIALLLNEKSKPAVRRPIMLLVERLLLAAGATESAYRGVALELVQPFITQILRRLRLNFGYRKAKQQIDKLDLSILSLLTVHVQDAATCDDLLQLLLPVLIARSQSQASEETVCQVITTLGNLIRHLDAPEEYLLRVAPLFEHVVEVAARKLLCQLIGDIAKKRCRQLKDANHTMSQAEMLLCARLRDTASIVLQLNAWDRRWVEQPDYDARLGALRAVRDKLSENDVDMDLGVLVIYNCLYFMRHDKDMGLRDNASEHLQLLLPQLAHRYANDMRQLQYLIGDVFVNSTRRLIGLGGGGGAGGGAGNEQARNEGIRLLGVMARECADTHELLADLAPLGNSQDPEVDFFENLVHLQTHRHGRALLKFCTHASTLSRPPGIRTLMQFVLPLARRYLLQDRYAGKHTLLDAAIETVGVCCQLLPWQHYHAVLSYYLQKMRHTHDHQRQCVRIVVRILDAFHFDLSQARVNEEAWLLLQQELKLKAAAVAAEADLLVEGLPKATPEAAATNEEDGEDGEEDKENEEGDKEADEAELTLDAADSDDDEENLDKMETESDQPYLKSSLLLTPSAAKRVLSAITTVLIPTLNRSITEKSAYDNKHKVNRKRFSKEREEEDILRVPLALAIVKLMQKLPKELLESGLSGVFMKVCVFLQSPLKSVRMLTRDILKKIMVTLGACYLPQLMDHLQNLLTRGFQVHVLAVTVHGVVDALRDRLQPADIEGCLCNLLDVALNDIFGDIGAQKEIDKITAHTPEAKPSAKSYLVLHIAARNIRENCLLDMLLPFKEHLARSHSRKVVLKIQECFAKIVSGLAENAHISREDMLTFIYGTVSESINELLPGAQRRVLNEQEKRLKGRERPDCLLIAQEPHSRSGAVHKNVKSNTQANAHVLIEFGLELLHILLKRKKLLASDENGVDFDYVPFLTPLLPLLRDALKSTHVRLTMFALRCLASIWNEEYELPALRQYLPEIVQRIFEILKNFSTFGASKQEDNLQLVKASFKAIVALLRNCPDYKLTAEQIDQLILQVEQDLDEEGDGGGSQATSFTLLKAMLARKVDGKSLHSTMTLVSNLAVTARSDYVRNESRAITITYIMEYTLGKRVDAMVNFFTSQLSYQVPAGRKSAIDFLLAIVRKFPPPVLAKHAKPLCLSLGSRLVHDEDANCRRAVAECLELLISRVDKTERQKLFDIVPVLLVSSGQMRELGVNLCSRFLIVERQAFAPRLKPLFPQLVERLANPNATGRFVRNPALNGVDLDEERAKQNNRNQRRTMPNAFDKLLTAEEDDAEAAEKEERLKDHEQLQTQYCLQKILECCKEPLFNAGDEELSRSLDELAYQSQKMLGHEHAWVRCNAAQILSSIIASYDYAAIGRTLCSDTEAADSHTQQPLIFIYLNPASDIKSLVLDLCAQMVPGDTSQVMIDQLVKIFLQIAQMLRDVPFSLNAADDGLVKETYSEINLKWLLRNVRFLINKEVAKAPHASSIRTAMFKIIEELIAVLSVETLQQLGPVLLPLLVREMCDDDQQIDADLRQLALRVSSRLRKRIGADVYDKLRTQAQTTLMMKRAERKKVLAQEKVHDPVRAAKRKVAMQERKKKAKKLKTEVIRGKAADIKQKLKRRKSMGDAFF